MTHRAKQHILHDQELKIQLGRIRLFWGSFSPPSNNHGTTKLIVLADFSPTMNVQLNPSSAKQLNNSNHLCLTDLILLS